MNEAFEEYLNEVVAHMAGMPIRRRDELSSEKATQLLNAFTAGYKAGWDDGKEYGEDNYFEGR